ncbi:lymphocyte antigen 6 complex, locus G6D, isoform CRA_d, partial [Mus musculus]
DLLGQQRSRQEGKEGHRTRCYDCGGGPSNSCKQTVITCGEGERCGFLDRKPQPSSEQAKQRESLVAHLPLPTASNQPAGFPSSQFNLALGRWHHC